MVNVLNKKKTAKLLTGILVIDSVASGLAFFRLDFLIATTFKK